MVWLGVERVPLCRKKLACGRGSNPTARPLPAFRGAQSHETPIQLLLDHELPLQELPLQEFPDQLLPDHELPDHEFPDQLLPDHEFPLQEFPDQLLPLQELPDHEFPLQEFPDQLLPLQELPDHEFPLQELPLQEFPDQLLPFQMPPLQLLPAASRRAIAPESKAWPKMSTAPLRTTPSRVRCSVPRESSSEPIPLDQSIVFHCTGAA
jgi:hypothetical protein